MKIDVSRRVDEVQLVVVSLILVMDRYGPRLDGDAALALDVEVVQNLVAEFTLRDRAGFEQQLIGQLLPWSMWAIENMNVSGIHKRCSSHSCDEGLDGMG